MTHRVVCISRVTAAGCETIGHSVAARLGFRYVDDEVITLAAEAAGVDPAVLENVEHHQGFLDRIMTALLARAVEAETYLKRPDREYYAAPINPSMAPPADELRRLIQHAIVEIARRGQAVIVAHAASIALRGHPDVLRVHVVASAATRARRLWLTNMLINEEEYAKAIAESDQQRQKYLARFYDLHAESPTDYDLVVNTDVLDAERATAAIVAVATTPPAG